MRRLMLALAAAACAATSAFAQEGGGAMPERRLIMSRDTDFFGGDLQPLFDTSLEACEALCLGDPACRAFTFNTRSNACFPKTGMTERKAYDGAISGEVVAVGAEALARAEAWARDLAFLDAADLRAAREEAAELALRHSGGQWSVEALRDAAAAPRRRATCAMR